MSDDKPLKNMKINTKRLGKSNKKSYITYVI